MSEAGDYQPATWAVSHDFGNARRSYAQKNQDRVQEVVRTGGASLLEDTVITQCENPLVVCCDVTGSMGEWPGIMFSKLPYLENEAKVYLGNDVEICWSAVRDFRDGNDYPLQARPFAKGADHLKRLEEIYRGGGGRPSECYDLAAAYFANNCKMPNAINPILIFIGDDTVYKRLTKEEAKTHGKVDLPKMQTNEQLFTSLKQIFDVYLVQKVTEVSGNQLVGYDLEVYKSWEPLLGADHIVSLPDPNRVVDCIFGILGEATGKRDYFVEELKERQLKDKDGKKKINTVMTAMKTIHVDPETEIKAGKRKPTKKLL